MEFKSYTEYLTYMDIHYTEDEQLIIEDFISYYVNHYRGLGHYNCERTYQDNLKNDANGKLHAFALIGFEFEKRAINNRKI